MTQRTDKVSNLVKELSAEYLARIDNKTSLITVTSCNVSPDLKHATLFITVLPEEKEAAALEFTRRQLHDLREILKKNMNTKAIPFLDIQIDQGEKNRQKIDELLRSK
jgi:ribosome-binding factor A